MNWLKLHKAWIITLAAGAVGFLTPSVNAYVTAHPQATVGLATVWGVVTAWAKSPRE